MRKLSLLLCFLASALATSAQVLTEKTGVIVQPETYFSGSCSTGRVGMAKENGNTYICTNSRWVRNSLPTCSPDPPSGACNSTVCLSTYADTPSLYACVGGLWKPVGSAIGGSGSLLSGVFTVGPGADSNGDGAIGVAEGPWNYNCSYDSFYSMYNIEDCLSGAIAQIRNNRNKPTVIMLMPGKYISTQFGLDLRGKSWFTITGLSRESVSIQYQSGDPLFTVDNTTHDYTFENMSIGGGQDTPSNPAMINGSMKTGDAYVRNITFDTQPSGSQGIWYVDTGDNVAPGPRVFFQNNICHGGHFCLDLRGFNDTDGDGTTNAYASIFSTGNLWSTEGYAVMPVSAWGDKISYFSSGDTYRADCMALGMDYPGAVTGVINSSSTIRRIHVTGSSFVIGRPSNPNVSRHVCNYPQGGPAAIVLGKGSDNEINNITTDLATDEYLITGNSFSLQRDTATSYVNAILHLGTHAVIKAAGNAVAVDDPTGYSFSRQTQSGGQIVYSGNIALTQDVASFANFPYGFMAAPIGASFGLVLTEGAKLAAVDGLVLRAEGKSGTKRIVLNTDPATFTSDVWGDLRVESGTLGATPIGSTAVANKETRLRFKAQDFTITSADDGSGTGQGGGGIRIKTNPTGTPGIHLVPDDPFNYAGASYVGTTAHPWNFLVAADSASNARVAQLRVVGSGVEWWIDTNNDGAVNSGDVCIGDGGTDADCNGTQDITAFFAGQAKGALAACTSGAPCFMSLNGVAATTTTESDVYLISPASGLTVRSLQCRLPSAVASGTYTFVVRTAGSTDSGVTCNITSSATQCSDTAHTLAVAANTLMTVKLYGASTPTAEAYGLCTVGYTLF